jgi:hypothetical protein
MHTVAPCIALECGIIADGAVLTATGFAVLIGVLAFGNPIGQSSGWWKEKTLRATN